MRLYDVTYYGMNADGNELFCKGKTFTDKEKAMACLQMYTNDFDDTLNMYLYPERVNLYTRLRVSEEIDGELKYIGSKIYSYSESIDANSDKDRYKRNEKINTCPEFFKTI